MWLQRLPGRLLARRAAAVARTVSGGAPTLVIRPRAASLRRCLHIPRAAAAAALAPRQTTGAGRRRFSAGPDASNPAGDAARYLELSPSTVERLGAELSSHGELLRRLEDDFASLTNKDHKRFGMLQKLADVHGRWATARAGYDDALEMVAEYGGGGGADDDESDEDAAEMRTMAEEEAAELRAELLELEHKMWEMLLPRDEADANNVLLETKAGVGGAEAALFTEEIFGMYKDYAARVGFKFEPLEVAERPEGGYRSATASVQALPGATLGPYEMLKFESGVHRVQRVPATEMQGRVHTSAVSVIVLPEPEEVEFDIAPSDIQKDVFRASGAGGQHVNTTESAVRLTHLPTGIKVAIQDERSQHSNYQKALKILRARVFDAHRQKVDAEHNAARQQHAGTGDRSEKVRTYNYHRDEVTDHRVRVTVKGIPTILRGGQGLDTFIDELSRRDQERRIAESSTAPDDGEEAAARK